MVGFLQMVSNRGNGPGKAFGKKNKSRTEEERKCQERGGPIILPMEAVILGYKSFSKKVSVGKVVPPADGEVADCGRTNLHGTRGGFRGLKSSDGVLKANRKVFRPCWQWKRWGYCRDSVSRPGPRKQGELWGFRPKLDRTKRSKRRRK